MKKQSCLASALSRNFTLLLLAALLFSAQQAVANIEVTLKLWRGYNTFYGQVTMGTPDPAPVTYHRVESPNKKIWRERSPSTNEGSFEDLGYAGLLDECTNGVWKLIRNVGHASAQTNTFSVSLTGVDSNMFGDITMIDPLYRAFASTNPPELQWTTTSVFPEIFIAVWDNQHTHLLGDSTTLPGTATNWTPSVALNGAEQLLLIQYQTNNFAGATFNLLSGPAVPGWSVSADLLSYMYSEFRLPGGGGSEFDIAVESPGLNWMTGGEYGGEDWFVQSNEWSVGQSAIQSGYTPDYAFSWIETTVTGPGTFSFEFFLSADDNDYLELSARDEYGNEYISYYYYGSDFWEWNWDEIDLEPGPNVVRWTFYNNDDTAGNDDTAFLDNVEYYPEAGDYEVYFSLEIEHVTTGTNAYYIMFPWIDTYPGSPTYDEVASPNWGSSGDGEGSSSSHYATFQDLIDEIEGGDWHLVFDVDGGYYEYNFTIDASALSANDLPPTDILYPLDGATGVATNTTFQWMGPTTFNSLYAIWLRLRRISNYSLNSCHKQQEV